MKMTAIRATILALALMVGQPGGQAVAEDPATIAGFTAEEALRLGERMYREGLLLSGEPMRGMVQMDIPVDGTMFSCASCHLRSGVGAIEGTVITLPTNAAWLFQPLQGARMTSTSRERLPAHLRTEEFRPAYNDQTLARALRGGMDPSGRKLHSVMPRYLLDDRNMEVFLFYLQNLSAQPSPGVTDTTLRFATVITDEVKREDREAMWLTLEAHIQSTNAQSRHQERRARQGPFYKEEKLTAYRRLELSLWELTGSPESWRAQLEKHYREKPVFALLGGISTRDWRPIHEFCEENGLPCIFPITDLPVVSETDWYSLYFSKGWYQEGETVAKYLRGMTDLSQDAPVVQVSRDDPIGRALSRGLQQTRGKLGQAAVESTVLEANEVVTPRLWRQVTEGREDAVLVAWLGPELLTVLDDLAASEDRPRMVFVSANLLAGSWQSLPDAARSFTYLTFPYSLPGEKPKTELAVQQWLRSRKIPMTNEVLQQKIYFIGWMLAGAIKHMRHDFYRDYFLDVMDMMRDQYYSVAPYWRLSFGPGQRYASKGCYIVQLTEGPQPELVKRSGWVVQ